MPREVLALGIVRKRGENRGMFFGTRDALAQIHKCGGGDCPLCTGRGEPRLVALDGVSKAAVLASLYNAAPPDKTMPNSDGTMEPWHAEGLFESTGQYVECVNGRPLYLDLRGSNVDVEPYERIHNCEGLATTIIEGLRT